jgi:hypothetical protein
LQKSRVKPFRLTKFASIVGAFRAPEQAEKLGCECGDGPFIRIASAIASATHFQPPAKKLWSTISQGRAGSVG